MPRDSNWNNAVVFPVQISRYTSGSSGVNDSRSMGGSPLFWRVSLTRRVAQSITVSVRRPRKSNLTRPIASRSSLSNWVTGWVIPGSQYKGENSAMGAGAMTNPPACFPAFRGIPSRRRPLSISWVTSASLRYRRRSSSSCAKAFSSVMPTSNGTSLARVSQKP